MGDAERRSREGSLDYGRIFEEADYDESDIDYDESDIDYYESDINVEIEIEDETRKVKIEDEIRKRKLKTKFANCKLGTELEIRTSQFEISPTNK